MLSSPKINILFTPLLLYCVDYPTFISLIHQGVKNFFGEDSFSVAEELNVDGSNIVTLIREAYEVRSGLDLA